MDREYMLQMIDERSSELEKRYREYFDTHSGPSKSKSGAAVMRSRIKKDLDLLSLLEYMLACLPDTFGIDDGVLINAFDRLVEPRRN